MTPDTSMGEITFMRITMTKKYGKFDALKFHLCKLIFDTTNSSHYLSVPENLLNCLFNPEAINQSWVAYITYIHTPSGWVYLVAVMDLFSRKIVDWVMAPYMRAELVTSAMQLAIAQRRPEPANLDKGRQ
ncbi:hypothetical protein PSE10B_43990 [Pseudomonas amygdali pv. eriobotryae]|uniref:Transposase IS3 n=3 Tax=Pseudomonas syringae group TaxID=136849 RepID=A0A0P9QDH1_PSEA0|nr:Transposase IS3/ family protein [Pseudomonas syringae pv. castaneae]KPX26235.1 Transposase IS3/ family protein [Pseudomonas amygdali pv. eriobotryae]RMS82988.1 Transposase IS3 [Pseudomonas savastanoi]RMV02043.1 hypothetical protein ALP18_200096 [Pseudomonas amygdali pv. myricae]RML95587.1 Transposase IS3 [Pseudomonas amygdali pv. eriobotryae]